MSRAHFSVFLQLFVSYYIFAFNTVAFYIHIVQHTQLKVLPSTLSPCLSVKLVLQSVCQLAIHPL